MDIIAFCVVGKRVVDFLFVLSELFSIALTVEALRADIGRNCGVRSKGGWVTLSENFRGRGSSTNHCWHQKTRVPGLSRGVVCVILCLAV